MGSFHLSSTMKVAFVLVLLVALVSSQQIERLLIDNFAVGANQQSVEVTLTATISTSDPPQSGEASFSSAGCGDELLGCGRDMQMLVTSGLAQRDFKSDIFVSEVPQFPQFVGEWSVQNPKTSSSVCTLQYDGIDNSFNLNINGLGGIDITDGGLSTDFVFTVTTDLEITYTIELHDTTGSVCRADLFVPVTPQNYDIDDIAVDISLNSFSGCDKTSIGAIQFLLPSDDAVDAIVRRVSIIGDPDPTQSNTPTPTRTRSPAPTGTGTPTPTPTRTPTRTPSPSGPCVIVCDCPSFTCQIAYDRDDDQNTISYSVSRFVFDDDDSVTYVYVDDDANPDDDGIVYVYVDDDDGISTGFTTLFSTGFTTLFSTGFSSFTSLFSTGFTSAFSSFTSFTSFDGSFSFGSSSSDASTVAASFVMMAVLAVLA